MVEKDMGSLIKQISYNNKALPVPVPVRNLLQLFTWLQDFIMKPDDTITKLKISSAEVDLESMSEKDFESFKIQCDAQVEVIVDHPLSIAVQTLDALRNMSAVLDHAFKPLAVTCWQCKELEEPADFGGLLTDLCLLVELTDHVILLLTNNVSTKFMADLSAEIKIQVMRLEEAISEKNWQSVARILLQKIEYPTQKLLEELEIVHITVAQMLPSDFALEGTKS